MVQASFGDYFGSLRLSRGLSFPALAARCEVSARTLSRWENGDTLPRTLELEAALQALRASEEERKTALQLVPAPRAASKARADAPGIDVPDGGDLLWGLRLKKGWSQERVAAALTVSVSTVSRWERNETWPAPGLLLRLCAVLEALPEEYAALQNGRYSLVSSRLPVGRAGAEAFEGAWRRHRLDYLTPEGYALYNLRCLALEEEGIRLLPSRPSVRGKLCRVLRSHARHLTLAKLHAPAERAAKRLISLSAGVPELRDEWLYGRIVLARSRVYASRTPAPRRGIRALTPLRSHDSDPAIGAWLSSELARFHALDRIRDAALGLAAEACRIAERDGSSREIGLRRSDLAAIHLEFEEPAEAIKLVTYNSDYDPETIVHTSLMHAEASIMLGHHDEANSLLSSAERVASEYRFDYLRPAISKLSERLRP